MPSFDLVSKTDMMEMKNALQMAQKEINSRYDFKGSDTSIELKESTIEIRANDDYKMKAALEILRGQLVKRNIGQRCIDPQKIDIIIGLSWALGLLSIAVMNWIANYMARREHLDIAEIGREIKSVQNGEQTRIRRIRKPSVRTTKAGK